MNAWTVIKWISIKPKLKQQPNNQPEKYRDKASSDMIMGLGFWADLKVGSKNHNLDF
jgi:hypothetical protein